MSLRPTPTTLLVGLSSFGLLAAALLGVESRYSAVEGTYLAAVYLALAVSLVLGSRWLVGWGRLGTSIAALGLSGVLLWQLRELVGQPEQFSRLFLAVALLAALLSPLVARLKPAGRGLRDLLLAGLAGLVFLLLVAVGYSSSNHLRWHLLRHNTLIGTPVFYLLDRPVSERQAELFEELARERGAKQPEEPGVVASEVVPIQRPNIVFLLLDTLRRDALAGWEGEPGQMPLLDRRLEGAWRFTDVWASATWTRPSVASFFTGLQPEAHGARGIEDALSREHTTLAEHLSDLGYETTAIVTNWGAVGAEVGFDQGFDLFREVRGEPYGRAALVNRTLDAWLASRVDSAAAESSESVEPADRGDGAELLEGQGSASSVGSKAADAPPAAPHFLYLHYLDPHEPYLAGVVPRRRSAGELRRAYRSELTELDTFLDAAIERIEASLSGPTVFVLVSDHGEEFYEHELFGHGFSLYDEVLSVPLAVWGEGLVGGRLEASLEGRDVFDLILSLALEPSQAIDRWAEENVRTRRYASIYYSSEGRLALRPYIAQVAMRAVQEGSEKLIWSGYGDTWELYDLASDPGEQVNLAARRPDRLRELSALFDDAVDGWSESTALEASDEALEQMRALGYVDD